MSLRWSSGESKSKHGKRVLKVESVSPLADTRILAIDADSVALAEKWFASFLNDKRWPIMRK